MKKPKDLKPGHRVQIEWQDSFGTIGWTCVEEPATAYPITSIGILVNISDHGLTITDSVDVFGEKIRTPLTIPWIAVTKFKQFEHIINIPKVN